MRRLRSLLKKVAGNKQLYDIVTALRGPDKEDLWHLKYVFTERIRYYASRDISAFALVRHGSKIAASTVYKIVDEALSWEGSPHYLIHVAHALKALAEIYADRPRIHGELSALAAVAFRLHAAARRKYQDKLDVNRTELVEEIIDILLDNKLLEEG